MATSQPTHSKKPVPTEVANAINALHAALNKHHGCDFAYTISVQGYIAAASNYVHGHITPTECTH